MLSSPSLSALAFSHSQDKRLKLISFTGSTEVGRHISTVVGTRFGRTILELGGNNALVVMDDANLDLALRAVCKDMGGIGERGCGWSASEGTTNTIHY